MEMQQQVTCPSCGNIISEKYCPTCGEKKSSKHDFTLKHFVEEGIEGLTHFDNKFFRSVKLLLFRPGMLTSFYSQGKRIPFMKPFQLFIVCNLIFFIFSGKFNFFSKRLQDYNTYAPYTNFNTKNIIAARAPTEERFILLAAVFNERIATESKGFVVLFIPVLALTSIIYLKKKRYLGEHLAFATHFFTFILLYQLVFSYLIAAPFYALTRSDYNAEFDQITAMLNLALFIIYYTAAARTFYKASTLHALAGALLAIVLFGCFVFSYRMLLFYKIIHSL